MTADQLLLGGSAGGSGGNGTKVAFSGGSGGSGIVLLCADSIDFTGKIDVSGGPGQAARAGAINSGASGDGGGGVALMATANYLPPNTGAIVVSGAGGTGLSGSGNGGAGVTETRIVTALQLDGVGSDFI